MDSSTIFFNACSSEWRCDELGATTAGLVNLSGHYIANPQGAALDASEVDEIGFFFDVFNSNQDIIATQPRSPICPPDSA